MRVDVDQGVDARYASTPVNGLPLANTSHHVNRTTAGELGRQQPGWQHPVMRRDPDLYSRIEFGWFLGALTIGLSVGGVLPVVWWRSD
jgi:hypothetical protein